MSDFPIQRALISVSNKQHIIPFAKQLHALGIELISTGGTSAILRAEGIPVKDVADLTQFPEIMDGRVKTLHPKIHGGILGKRDVHAAVAKTHEIGWIDLVVVNLYPFAEVSKKSESSFEEVIENIDIGGPSMIRSAAKNHAFVTVVVDPKDYEEVAQALTTNQGLSFNQRKAFAQKAFAHTAQYDFLIQDYLLKTEITYPQRHPESNEGSPTKWHQANARRSLVALGMTDEEFPSQLLISFTKENDLRYGENPHQQASIYRINEQKSMILDAKKLQGKSLSYNNIVDAEAAITSVQAFHLPACVIVKHANPCGVAIGRSAQDAFQKALEADATSAFGGIIAFNCLCDEKAAEIIASSFFELVIAPEISTAALKHFSTKPNLRVLTLPKDVTQNHMHYQWIDGALLAQQADLSLVTADKLERVTETYPTDEDLNDLLFAWQVVKQVKSNAIVIAKHQQTLGIGPGQVSRVTAVDIAIQKAGIKTQQAVLASDAFFPFKDSIERIAEAGIRAIIQPGGSIRDNEVIEACNAHGIAMVFTGIRCFKH